MKTLSQKRANDCARQQRHREYLAAGIAVAHSKIGQEVQAMLIRGKLMPENWTNDDLNSAVSEFLEAIAASRQFAAPMSALPPKADIPDKPVNVR